MKQKFLIKIEIEVVLNPDTDDEDYWDYGTPVVIATAETEEEALEIRRKIQELYEDY